MSERDTHFAGWASLLYPDLARLFMALASYRIEGEEEKANMVEVVIKDVLTQRGYDLVKHAFYKAEIPPYEFEGPVSDLYAPEDIPDMTEWPQESGE